MWWNSPFKNFFWNTYTSQGFIPTTRCCTLAGIAMEIFRTNHLNDNKVSLQYLVLLSALVRLQLTYGWTWYLKHSHRTRIPHGKQIGRWVLQRHQISLRVPGLRLTWMPVVFSKSRPANLRGWYWPTTKNLIWNLQKVGEKWLPHSKLEIRLVEKSGWENRTW